MPTINIEGRPVTVDDSFLKLSPEDQNKTVDEIAGHLKVTAGAKDQPSTLTDVARSAATGVPILGGMLNKLDAATNAALAPVVEPFLSNGSDTLDQPTFGERYAKSLDIQNKRDSRFAEQHPIVDTAAKVAGGIASLAPAVAAAPAAFGAAGTLPQMVIRGGASGAALSAADAAVRGEDVADATGIGALTGAAAGLAGRIIGKGVARLTRGAPAAPVPHTTMDVAGTPVPVPNADPEVAAQIEIARKGGSGQRAQDMVTSHDDATAAALTRATDQIAADLNGGGAAPGARVAPAEAADRVAAELGSSEATRLATEQNVAQRTALEGQRVRGAVAPDPYTGMPMHVADSPYAAAEGVGAGVAGRSESAQRGVARNYDAANAVPGAFDPAVPKTLAEEIRTRLNTGPDKLWVDPQSTSAANQALRLIDQDVGSGLFHNAAAERPGAAPGGLPAVTGAAVPTEAAQAFDTLRAQGVPPERARSMVARLPGAERLPGGPFEPHTVSTPSGRQVQVEPVVVEGGDVRTSTDAGYDPALQPRDRRRAASDAQINDIAKNLNPARLGHSAEADRGAPIVGPDGMIESGTGRMNAIRQAYAENGPAAERYRSWLQSQGVDVTGFKHPVLVRERQTQLSPADRKAFTVEANQSSTLSLSAPERALADARALSPETLGMIRNPADLGAVENRDFVRQFMQSVPAAERGGLMTANGDLSSEGLARVRNAVLAKAYGDSPALARIAESTNDGVKSISNGLTAAAPEWAQLRGAISKGAVPAEFDKTADLLDAVERTATIRGKGVGLDSAMSQRDAFSQQSPESETFMRMFYGADGKSAAPGSQVANGLRDYAQQAAKVDAAPGLDLGLKPVTAAEILERTAAKAGAPKELAAEVKAAAVAKPAEAAAVAEEHLPEVGVREMDNARKRLNVLRGDAIKAAMAPGGSGADLRAINRIIHEFDGVVNEALSSGKFSGDSEAARSLIEQARASHAEYRQTFTSRGGADPVGRSVEKILGRYHDTAASPDEIAKLSYGSVSEPGGGAATRVAQRLRQILGPTSPEWGGYKQGLVSLLVDRPEGGARPPAEAAERIRKYLSGTTGRVHAQAVFSADERAALATHADSLERSVPATGLNSVDKIIARITGRDGGIPAGVDEVTRLVMGSAKSTAAGENALRLGQRLKQVLSPEGFDTLRGGILSHLVERPPGIAEWSHKQVADNIHNFLNRHASQVYFTAAQRGHLADLAAAHKAQIPPPGTVNTSNTATTLSRMAKSAKGLVLPALGAATHGPLGVVAGMAANKAASGIGNARAAKQIESLLYRHRPKPAADPRFAIAASLANRGALQGQSGSR